MCKNTERCQKAGRGYNGNSQAESLKILSLKNSEEGLQIMKDEKTDIAKELSRICKEKGISRYSLSKRTGIPDSTLQNYENGTTPNFSTLEIICEALGTTIAGFFQGDCFSYFTEDQEELMSPF